MMDLDALTIVPLTATSLWSRAGDDPLTAMRLVLAAQLRLHHGGIGYDRRWGWKWDEDRVERERASLLEPGRLEQFVRAAHFLSAHADFAQDRFNRRRSSYSWKHVAERWAGAYVSDGTLIAAAYALGFRVDPIEGTPSAHINLAEKAAERAAT